LQGDDDLTLWGDYIKDLEHFNKASMAGKYQISGAFRTIQSDIGRKGDISSGAGFIPPARS
jgi:hypothetical protein